MMLRLVSAVMLVMLGVLGVARGEVAPDKELAVFDFETTQAARAVWIAMAGSAPVEIFEGEPPFEHRGVRFPCNFTQLESRAYWDTTIAEDLTGHTNFTLRVYVEDPLPVSSLTLYFRSGAGWYSSTWGNLQRGWQELRRARADFNFSGTPTGWHAIDGIRFSPWKASGAASDTVLIANELRATNPRILVVKGTKSTAPSTAESTVATMAQCLDVWGIDYATVTEEDVEDGVLEGASLAIFPYSNNMSVTEIEAIEDFVAAGGKIVVFFTAPTAVFSLLGLQNLGSAGIAPRAMRFHSGIVDCVPDRADQASWNYFRVVPTGSDVEVLADWEDADGVALDDPAWTINNSGAYMSHILLSDDLENKRRLMLALAAHFVPTVEDEVSIRALRDIGNIGTYLDFDDAVAGIRESAAVTPRATLVEEHLASATGLRDALADSWETDPFCSNIEAAMTAREHLLEAYALAQEPEWPEMRAAWASFNASSGPFVDGWEKMARDLAANGFNAVMPYMVTGGVAHYDSEFLPRSASFDERGDHIAACIAACQPLGIETHVRKLNWFLLGTPQDFIDTMRAAERTQVDVDGAPVDWLCPSHPLNFELEMNVMLEIVDNYDVDGIHYDFIRYPDSRSCYCDGCRVRFEADTGLETPDWPLDCYSGVHREAYREWRREQITRVVRAMREALDARESDVQISAAVFSSYPACRDTVGQDWIAWIEAGYLDFVCPMDYRSSVSAFEALVTAQLGYVAGRVPMYPGVGVASSQSQLSPDEVIAQLLVTRRHATGGFVLFVYNDYLADHVLPTLRKGLTAGTDGSWLMVR